MDWSGQGRRAGEPSSRVNQGVGGAGAGERLLSHPLSQPAEPALGPNPQSEKEKQRPGAEWNVEGVPAQPQKHLQTQLGMLLSVPPPSLTSAGWLRNPTGERVTTTSFKTPNKRQKERKPIPPLSEAEQ